MYWREKFLLWTELAKCKNWLYYTVLYCTVLYCTVSTSPLSSVITMIHGGAMYSTKYINTANTNNLFSAQSQLNVSKSLPLLNGFIEACVPGVYLRWPEGGAGKTRPSRWSSLIISWESQAKIRQTATSSKRVWETVYIHTFCFLHRLTETFR